MHELSDSAREEMVGNLIKLSRSSAWKYLKSYLESLRKEAQNELLSSEISAAKNLNPLEATRREINYIDTLIGMPENLAGSLKEKRSTNVDDLDPQKPATTKSDFPQDDSFEPADTPARPTGGF